MNRGLLDGVPHLRQMFRRSFWPKSLLTNNQGGTGNNFTADATWETITGCSTQFTSVSDRTWFLVRWTGSWRASSGNWQYHDIRPAVDGVGMAYVSPSCYDSTVSAGLRFAQIDSSGDQSQAREISGFFLLRGVPPGQHTLTLETYDGSSSLDRTHYSYQISIEAVDGVPLKNEVGPYRGLPLNRPVHPRRRESMWLGSVTDTSQRDFNTTSTWETISGTTIEWDNQERYGGLFVIASIRYRPYSANWENFHQRLLLNGSTTGVNPSLYHSLGNNNDGVQILWKNFLSFYQIENPGYGKHQIYLQTHDNNSGIDRRVWYTRLDLFRTKET